MTGEGGVGIRCPPVDSADCTFAIVSTPVKSISGNPGIVSEVVGVEHVSQEDNMNASVSDPQQKTKAKGYGRWFAIFIRLEIIPTLRDSPSVLSLIWGVKLGPP